MECKIVDCIIELKGMFIGYNIVNNIFKRMLFVYCYMSFLNEIIGYLLKGLILLCIVLSKVKLLIGIK